jgi:hypothetical protein
VPANGSTNHDLEKHDYFEKIMPRNDAEDDAGDEEEDEDLDQLISDLESQDGENADYEEEEEDQPGGARLIPEELLQTDTYIGLGAAEVLARRKKFGLNQMKGICRHLFNSITTLTQDRRERKPAQEVPHVLRGSYPIRHGSRRDFGSRTSRLGRLRRHLWPADTQRCCRLRTRIQGWQHR